MTNLTKQEEKIIDLHYLAQYATQLRKDIMEGKEPNPHIYNRIKELADRIQPQKWKYFKNNGLDVTAIPTTIN